MEYELVKRRHPHPLLFNDEHIRDDIECSRCHQPLYPPAFTCSSLLCNFNIHLSCLHLTPQIRTHLHPQHPLNLHINKHNCDGCGQITSVDNAYECGPCHFKLDINCAIVDTKNSGLFQMGKEKYQHFSHPHPLTLANVHCRKVCFLCHLLVESGSSTYSCSQCDNTHFHKQCAELPRELPNSDCHPPHPLFLRFIKNDDVFCNSCRNRCRGFVYACSTCKFFLHLHCFQTFNHEHAFTNMLQNMIAFRCRICGEMCEDRFPLCCDICHALVHKECAEWPSKLKLTEHNHPPLSFYHFLPDTDEITLCNICGTQINTEYAVYGCSECNYFTHLNCGQDHQAGADADVEAENKLIHRHDSVGANASADVENKLIHRHKLTLFPFLENEKILKDRVCDGCMKCLSISGPSYGCSECDFFVHEECTKLPTNEIYCIHKHPLTLISIPNFIFQCEACLHHFHGFAYQCKTCHSTFDLRCTSIQIPFKHPNHQHPLCFNDQNNRFSESPLCEACGKNIKEKLWFRCTVNECNKFHLHLGCATLPVTVRYRFDPHPLNLTFVEEERVDDYYCDICEEKREAGLWFYRCKKCSFAGHTRCVLGEFPYVKSMVHKLAHPPHPLNLVMKEGESSSCGGCNESWSPNLAYECGGCNFNVHATGRCFELQLLKGNLAFTNRNVFSRANQPYHHPIKSGMGVTLGPFGRGSMSSPWKESVFSTISGFFIYHNEYKVYGIRIQYAKDGELVWSNNHGTQAGSKNDEVCFNYPDEYLVSIDGCYISGSTVKSLTIQTNTKTYGPFGDKNQDGQHFSSLTKGVEIVAIFGSGNDFDSIGFQGIPTISTQPQE